MGLAAMGAGIAVLIEHAGDDHLDGGASVAYLCGPALFLLALIVMRTVTVGGPHLVGAAVKGCAAALLLGIAALHGSLPVLLVAAAPAAVLVALVVAEHAIRTR